MPSPNCVHQAVRTVGLHLLSTDSGTDGLLHGAHGRLDVASDLIQNRKHSDIDPLKVQNQRNNSFTTLHTLLGSPEVIVDICVWKREKA